MEFPHVEKLSIEAQIVTDLHTNEARSCDGECASGILNSSIKMTLVETRTADDFDSSEMRSRSGALVTIDFNTKEAISVEPVTSIQRRKDR